MHGWTYARETACDILRMFANVSESVTNLKNNTLILLLIKRPSSIHHRRCLRCRCKY